MYILVHPFLPAGGNLIGPEGATQLAAALSRNRCLCTLNLRSNAILDAGAVAVAHAVKRNDTLLNLYLGANSITEEGTLALADSLRANSRLQKLDLQGAAVGGRGARAIAEALKVRSLGLRVNPTEGLTRETLTLTLTPLSLSSNTMLVDTSPHFFTNDAAVDGRGARAIAKALKARKHTTHSVDPTPLSLSSNTMLVDTSPHSCTNDAAVGGRGARAVAEALKARSHTRAKWSSWNLQVRSQYLGSWIPSRVGTFYSEARLRMWQPLEPISSIPIFTGGTPNKIFRRSLFIDATV